jgi:hypothetical protein
MKLGKFLDTINEGTCWTKFEKYLVKKGRKIKQNFMKKNILSTFLPQTFRPTKFNFLPSQGNTAVSAFAQQNCG